MNKSLALGLFLCAAASACAQTVSDIEAPSPRSSYLQDGRNVIVRSQDGLCWRTGSWTPADAVTGCDGNLLPPIAKPTAPEIAPPAVATPAPAPAAPRRCDFSVTLGSDQAFAFNKTTLTDAARKRIDNEVLDKLTSCTKVDLITVTGHTDRLGSEQYNRKLSEKRAEAVSSYLKSKGVKADINALGAGAAQPTQSCAENQPKSKLIKCLAPNRRAVIEVRGIAE